MSEHKLNETEKEFLKMTGMQFPLMIFGFNLYGDALAFMSEWHPLLEQHTKGVRLAEIEKNLDRLSKSLKPVLEEIIKEAEQECKNTK